MKVVKVPEKVFNMVETEGKCDAQYCPGHTVPASLSKGDVIKVKGGTSGKTLIVEVLDKVVKTDAISILLKKMVGVA